MSWADEREQVELVNLLIQAGTDVNAADRFGATSLKFAAEIGSIDSVKALVSAGANINFQDPTSHRAYLEIGRLPDTAPVDFNQVGNAPLHDAALQGRVEVAQVLIGAGADVNAKNRTGKTPLDLAEQYGHGSVAAVLKAAGGQRGG